MIIYFRGIFRALPKLHKNNKIYYWLRKKIFLTAKRFLFENSNLEKKFNEELIYQSKNKFFTSVLYTRFYYPNIDTNKNQNTNSKLNIGILGSIDPIRKNYKLIKEFSKNNKNRIKIIFLCRYL